jgi:tetratricopeptide (TPR) repeat protein
MLTALTRTLPSLAVPSAPPGSLASGTAVPPATAAPAAARSRANPTFRSELAVALEHHARGRFAEARAAFLRALALAPPNADRASLEVNIAACNYDLGAFREAEAGFERAAKASPDTRGAALLQAGWAALAAGDDRRARAHLEAAAREQAPDDARLELQQAIEAASAARESAELTREIEAAARAYEQGAAERARALVRAARAHEHRGTPRSRAALAYLEALLLRDDGDDEAARRALERSVREDPSDPSARVLLAELALARGDRADAEHQYRASLDADLSPRDASTVRQALAALYGLPPQGLDAWASVGAGYDSNATLSGSSEAIGYAGSARHGSPFTAPAWGVEHRWPSGERSRIGAYYVGDWLLLGDDTAADASLMTHEAGLRYYLAPSSATELRLAAGAGPTFSGLSLSPFSLDALVRARFALRHTAQWRTHVAGELRPSIGLGGQDYLSGVRAELGAGERFQSGRWSAGASAAWRHNGIGTWSLPIAEPLPGCILGCELARYHIPLGYSGPIVDADVNVEIGGALELGTWLKYEHRTFLDDSRIEGEDVPALVQRLSRKTREDDRYSLGARARYRLGERPELGAWLQYALRVSRSNVAFGSAGLEHAFDYDDRNFSQHVIELGIDARY